MIFIWLQYSSSHYNYSLYSKHPNHIQNRPDLQWHYADSDTRIVETTLKPTKKNRQLLVSNMVLGSYANICILL